MSRARPLPVAPWLAALLAAATLACAAPAQPAPENARQREFLVGSEVLRWMLKTKEDFSPLNERELSRLREDPEHTVLIVLGDLRWLDVNLPEGVEDFVGRGGALLAASDKPSGDQLIALAGVRIPGLHMECSKPNSCYRELPYCPFVKRNPGQDLPGGAANPFDGDRVATNVPSVLIKRSERKPGGTVYLATFPGSSSPAGADVSDRYGVPKDPLFAVGGERGKGRFLILADHSVFINQMMWDVNNNDNLVFARRCLEWLKGNGERTHALLVIDGQIEPNFDVPLRKLPPIPPMKILEQMFVHRDEIIEEAQERFVRAEEDGWVDRGILRTLAGKDDEGLPRLSRYVWWGIGGALATLLFYRLRNQGRYLSETGLPRLGTVVAGQRPAGPLFEQRQREQVAAGNLWEAARGLARQRLAPLAATEGPPARSLVTGSGWSRRRAAWQRLRRLWEIAYGPVPVAIPPARWEFFLSEIEAFERDVADGTVKLPAV